MDGAAFLEDARRSFAAAKDLADRAIAQIDDTGFFATPGPETNSIAIIVKHMAGNLRSRWTDFLTTDGEKPDRNRDAEFESEAGDSREALVARWDSGWGIAFASLEALGAGDLVKTVYIRGEAMSVGWAILRSLTHAHYHTGQIVLLARHYAGVWETLSILRAERSASDSMLKKTSMNHPIG
jgi:uncharacterized damage-inducible protein DinB